MEIVFNIRKHRWFTEEGKGFRLECGRFIFWDIKILLRFKESQLNVCGNYYIKNHSLMLKVKYNKIFLSYLFIELAKNKHIHISDHEHGNLIMGVCEAELKVAEKSHYYLNVL